MILKNRRTWQRWLTNRNLTLILHTAETCLNTSEKCPIAFIGWKLVKPALKSFPQVVFFPPVSDGHSIRTILWLCLKNLKHVARSTHQRKCLQENEQQMKIGGRIIRWLLAINHTDGPLRTGVQSKSTTRAISITHRNAVQKGHELQVANLASASLLR